MILNRQQTVRVARPPLEQFLRRLRKQLGIADARFTVCMVSDAEIARMNESFRKKKGPTDVLSFPAVELRKPLALPRRDAANGKRALLPAPDGGRRLSANRALQGTRRHIVQEGTASAVPKRAIKRGVLAAEADFLGDIAISPATARRNARKYKRTLPNELQILILHGVLHLLGYDHETDRGQMARIESRLRQRLGIS
jgi:rRNA maturation RNase YbeY